MIILLGLQIFKVANQLINSSNGADLGFQSIPIPLFDSLVLNYNTLNPIDSLNRDSRDINSNQTYFADKFDSNNNSNEFSKRSGFFENISNQSISKPYPYSRDLTNSDQIPYSYPNSSPNPSSVSKGEKKFYGIKPNSNEFEDSIDHSLNEPKRYYPNELKSEEKRDYDTHEENNSQNSDRFDTDYVEHEDPTDLDQPEINDGYDIDEDDREEENLDHSNDSNYQEEATPECAFGHSYCYFDEEYPEASMRKAVDKQMDILTQILPESTETLDLVEGIPKEIDENYTYIDSSHDLYNSESSEQMSYENENALKYRDGGYICPSYVNYIKPKRAQNNDGLWKVILNLNESYRGVDYTQHIRIEECVYEKIKCSFALNYYKSECIQKYSNERLLAWTPDKGIHLDVFRLPIACSCHLIPQNETKRTLVFNL